MARRTYNQFCGLAGALDVVGERWTLLIIRDLMAGPMRYTDLATSLDGIGTSLLASRVKQLETDGLVTRRELPPPAASTVYELTPTGWDLADALIPLAVWGTRHQLPADRANGQRYRSHWSLAVLARVLSRVADGGTVYDFSVDGEESHIALASGAAEVIPGPAPRHADVRVAIGSTTLAALVAGRLEVADAVAAGRITVSGDNTAIRSLVAAAAVSR